MVIIEMENGKEIKIELYPDIAPISCENFEKLVEIVKEAGELNKETQVPYDKLVTSKIIEEIKNAGE